MTNISDDTARTVAKNLWEILEEFFEEELVELIHDYQEAHPV